jgi:hypothetical protein
MVGQKIEAETDFLILMGQSTDVVENMAIGYGVPKNKILNLGFTTPEKIFEKILSVTEKISTIVAIGNMGGMGADTVEFFKNRSV